MLKNNKVLLLNFILRTGMFVSKTDEFNIQSFLIGYEIGKDGNSDFMAQLEDYLKEKYKLPLSNTRWHGQIVCYAKKKSISWYTAFRQISLEIFTLERNGGVDEDMKVALKNRIGNLINQLSPTRPPFLDERWIEDFIAFVPTKSRWFKEIWSKKEYNILKSIHQLINKEMVFEPDSNHTPTQEILELKNSFNALQN